jgi:DNA-directed RNA polymerase subunit M/transcription elongation factor TFIIS
MARIDKIHNRHVESTDKDLDSETEQDQTQAQEENPQDSDTDALYDTIYKQLYTKFLIRYNRTAIIDNISMSREEVDPEKWSALKNTRSEDSKKIKKKGAHKCTRCKSWFTEHTESQRAAADESMCVSVSCLDCGHHFKYS